MPGLPTNRLVAAPPNVTMGHLTYDVIARRRNPHWGGAESHPPHPQWRTTASVPTSPANASPLTPTPTPSPVTPSPISPAYPNVVTLSVVSSNIKSSNYSPTHHGRKSVPTRIKAAIFIYYRYHHRRVIILLLGGGGYSLRSVSCLERVSPLLSVAVLALIPLTATRSILGHFVRIWRPLALNPETLLILSLSLSLLFSSLFPLISPSELARKKRNPKKN